MTNPAPPARTQLTPDERIAAEMAFQIACSSSVEPGIRKRILAALTSARTEGRLAGLREAMGEVEAEMSDPPDDTQETTWGFLDACQRIDKRIRGLAEAGPKAPKDQANPADPEPR